MSSTSLENRPLTTSEKFTIVMLTFSNFIEGVFFSFLASFFPPEALEKGLKNRDVAIIMTAFQVSSIIFSVIGGFLLEIMKPRTMYLLSYVISSLILIPFAFVLDINNYGYFYLSTLVCRAVQGMGLIGIQLSAMSIIMTDFKQYMSTLYGTITMAYGFGAAFGPLFSGLLVDNLGIKAPFFVLSIITFASFILAYILVRPSNRSGESTNCSEDFVENTDNIDLSARKVIGMPELLIPVMSAFTISMCVAFFDLSVSTFLMKLYDVTATTAGAILMIGAGLYAVSSPFVGIYLDKYGHFEILTVIGMLFMLACLLLVEPVPFLNIPRPGLNWVAFNMVLFGLGCSLTSISSFLLFFLILSRNDITETTSTKNFINSATTLFRNSGSLIGPIIGGVVVDYFGFDWALFFLAVCMFILLIGTIVYICLTFFKSVTENYQQIE